LILIYKKREEDESKLGLKIVGYYLLGVCTFRLDGIAIPLGFLIYLLFFRPTQNGTTKRAAAFLGLAIFILQLVIPAVENYLYERPREAAVSSENMFEIQFTNDWNRIRDQLGIDPNARLEDFRAEYQRNGQIEKLSYDVIGHSDDEYIYYEIAYSSETNTYTIERRKVGDRWLQYDRTVLASRFFEVLDQVQVRTLSRYHSSDGNILLRSDGQMDNYAIEDTKKYLIQENELTAIANDKLPVTGYSINTCERALTMKTPSGPVSTSGCINQTDFFFDVTDSRDPLR
jgi:hypothetical protein